MVPTSSNCTSFDPLDNQLQPLIAYLRVKLIPIFPTTISSRHSSKKLRENPDLEKLTLEFTENIPALI